MVTAVRRGESLRQVAKRFRVSVSTVHYWVDRAVRVEGLAESIGVTDPTGLITFDEPSGVLKI